MCCVTLCHLNCLWSFPVCCLGYVSVFASALECLLICLAVPSSCVVVQLAKYNVCRYTGCIIDPSNWSGPFSLVVMMPD